MPKLKAIFFDLDETLIENRLSVTEVFGRMYTDFEDELGPSNQKPFFGTLSECAKNVWSQMFEVDLTPERQLIQCFETSIKATEAVAEARQFSLAQDMFDHFLNLSSNNVRFQDQAEHVLEDLRSIGYQTGIITNGIEQIQLGKIEKLNLVDKVDTVTVSAQARAHKPLAPVFELALSRTGCTAEESMMVGDHPTNDVAGSIRMGMKGIYYNPKQHDVEHAFSALEERPNHVIEEMPGLLSLLW